MAFLKQEGKISRRMLLRLAPALLGTALALGLAPASAQSSSAGTASAPLQIQVMAASLFRFLAYVEWPPDSLPPGAPYVIAVAGADALADELAAVVASRTINDRAVKVRRIKSGEAPDGVHALFIGGNPAGRMPPQRARRWPVLIVTDAEGALDQGSMINFRLVDGRMRFEVALDTAEEADLRISSRMLGLAWQVRKTPPR